MFFQKWLKNGCNNLYFHPYIFDISNKLFSYLTSFSRCNPVNPSTQLLSISVWQKQWQIYMLLGNFIKRTPIISIGTLNPKLTFKPNSYLSSIFRRGPVDPLNLTFSNINLTKKKWQIYLLFQNSLKNGCNNLYFHLYTSDICCGISIFVSFACFIKNDR